ncbi:MAG TPA: hypothetical protein VGP92_04060 [Acidimicrobiia bacterium]|nr:hypothetical protein [Acidimicrobiia bacterium]
MAGVEAQLSVFAYQAAGMVAGQLECTATEALGRLRAVAAAGDKSLDDVAFDVINGDLRFDA